MQLHISYMWNSNRILANNLPKGVVRINDLYSTLFMQRAMSDTDVVLTSVSHQWAPFYDG